MEILIFAFLCYGISNIIVFGSIFKGIRFLLKKHNPTFLGALVECMMCTSFWVGIFVSYFISSPLLLYFPELGQLGLMFWLFTGSLSSGLVWFIHTIQEWFERE